MAKRKRAEGATVTGSNATDLAPSKKARGTVALDSKSPSQPQQRQKSPTKTQPKPESKSQSQSQSQVQHFTTDGGLTLQIVTGSYDRVLHGILATVTPEGKVEFADTFLFNAHPSAIRCVALSPPTNPAPGQDQKVLLASGSTDPKVNIYTLSAHPPKRREKDEMSSAGLRPILENSKNRELGAYNPHDSTVTKLVFPTRSKLISSSEDSTISVAKTRNWETMSTIKVPIPKAQGRPSGDTAPLGGSPAGVNDFAVHPSMKLLISVSKGERCIRLWNLLTGKKAAVLNFGREMLQEIGEGKHSTGEGRQVAWGATAESEEFAVGFDRDIVVFGMDSLPRCRVMPDARTKIHHMEYISVDDVSETTLIAVSTEDGRILFCSTREEDLTRPPSSKSKEQKLPVAKLVAQIGGKEAGVTGRIKDFNVVRVEEQSQTVFYLVGGSSDGKVRLWKVGAKELLSRTQEATAGKPDKQTEPEASAAAPQVGNLLGAYETNNRITCTAAFAMIPRPDGVGESDDEMDDLEEETEDNSSDDGDEGGKDE
ncbi:WD40 repeat-like protein [Sodiomyces alkalinus F11]|uniref:WD40 repeat-like protein n=1 Tax=Sodiomyces alkalinus (strain CBS 110278 / VKM F-3762 / F11) TaxID=1314773 RepID=A0A3N2Q806_SODAK|nr:WD40 repeat-like protein [Sodiomyces alkalinus F11]ROT42798.1 WD40 repeat-like protein [Sodiomyces alkalinus F11]